MLGLAAFGTVAAATPASAGNPTFQRTFNPEKGFNTYTTNDILHPSCPQAIAGTPGSDPATKVLNDALNTKASFYPGGTVHYIYTDNPHLNAGTQNFTIQDCLVAYPAGSFTPASFGPGGVLLGGTKQTLPPGGTPIDGAALSGIRSAEGNIYFSWTSHDVAPGDYVCNFARDIRNNHGGGGNRKVSPTCFQVTQAPPPPPPLAAFPPNIYVGYADDYRGGVNPNHHPVIWDGSPNVKFVGCTPVTATAPPAPGCPNAADAGAIRFDNVNTDGSSMTVTFPPAGSPAVQIGSCGFNPWPGQSYTIPAGGTLVLTETGGFAGPADCMTGIDPSLRPFTNFDTSEYPNEPLYPAPASCVPNSFQPKISFTLTNGGATTSTTVVDTKQILNTGGFDQGAQGCGDANETKDWVTI